jgi:hypothetical protein
MLRRHERSLQPGLVGAVGSEIGAGADNGMAVLQALRVGRRSEGLIKDERPTGRPAHCRKQSAVVGRPVRGKEEIVAFVQLLPVNQPPHGVAGSSPTSPTI